MLLFKTRKRCLPHGLEKCLCQRTIDSLNILLSRMPNGPNHLLNLVQGGRAREYRFANDQLAQDAARTPHVHRLGVHGRAEQDLGRTLPPRGHLVGQDRGLVVVVLLRHRPRQSEVCHLHVALGVQQQVGRFQVPVDQVARVQVF